MVQLVFTATGNVPKLADTINGITSYGLHDSFRIATEISRGIKRKFPISSIEKTTDIINKTMPAGTLAWHFLNDTTGEIFGGTSGIVPAAEKLKKEVDRSRSLKVLTIYSVCGNKEALGKALENSIRILKSDVNLRVDTIYEEVERNGLWRSPLMPINVDNWITADLKDEWSIFDKLTEELISSPKRKKKPCKSEKFSNKGHELINTVANSMQDLTHYYEKLEAENAKLCNQVETLLKKRDELITKLDVLSDKFIKLKSILD